MKVGDLNREKLAELIAAVLFRVDGTIHLSYAANDFIEFANHWYYSKSPHSPFGDSYFRSGTWDALIGGLMLGFAVPLAHLVCRGLIAKIEASAEN
jgi:hypothetical protein